MDQIETKFLRIQSHQPIVWLRYVDNIFLFDNMGKKNLKEFMADFNAFNPNIQFTYESSKKVLPF